MAIEVLAERDVRGPGCDDRCRFIRVFQPGVYGRQELLLCSREAHERYGRLQERGAGDVDIVRTGRLSINRDTLTVCLDGRVIPLAPAEMRLLLALSQRLGSMVPYGVILAEAWNIEFDGEEERQMMRTTAGRLRSVLTDQAGLIQTVTGFGLRLLALPPGMDAPPVAGGQLRGRWSRKHAACLGCGTTDRAHFSRGFCSWCAPRRGGASS
jgi:hypothetical protein